MFLSSFRLQMFSFAFRQTTLCADQSQGLHGLDYLRLCQHFSFCAYYDVRSYQCKFMVVYACCNLISGLMLSCNSAIDQTCTWMNFTVTSPPGIISICPQFGMFQPHFKKKHPKLYRHIIGILYTIVQGIYEYRTKLGMTKVVSRGSWGCHCCKTDRGPPYFRLKDVPSPCTKSCP